jgi:hypothetical protein
MHIPIFVKRGAGYCATNANYPVSQNTLSAHTHADNQHKVNKNDNDGNPCPTLSNEERIALAAGMSFGECCG